MIIFASFALLNDGPITLDLYSMMYEWEYNKMKNEVYSITTYSITHALYNIR